MYVLSGENWSDRILDYHRPEGRIRVAVAAWAVVRPVPGIYLVPPRSPALLWSYLKEFGPGTVIRKVRSRLGERWRNEKFVSVGVGRLIPEPGAAGSLKDGPVFFLAPAHPRCLERIVLPPELVQPCPEEVSRRNRSPEGIRFHKNGPELPRLEDLAGWDPESGRPLDDGCLREIFAGIGEFWAGLPGNFRLLKISGSTEVSTSARPRRRTGPEGRPTAVLFGLGNYAKTQILPNLDPGLRVAAIREIDPTQIGDGYRDRYEVSTDPSGAGEDRYDVYLIAGYHHTHAGLAVQALESGAAAVVEKPLVTTREQLESLMSALRRTGGRLFGCFQMRYNPLFALARRDLEPGPGEPVHVTADVFEIPLPPHHWYRWPSSGSHLVSNGCHWLDHFLFMNGYSAPVRRRVGSLGNGDTVVEVELENGACLLLHLTHRGSPRIGVREYLALRRGDRTVTVTDGSAYRAEDRFRVIRKKRINKMEVYRRMYREISRKVLSGEPGDSPESVEITGSLMLDLEEDLRRRPFPGK